MDAIPADASAHQISPESFIRKVLMAVSDPATRHSLLTVYLQEQTARILRLPVSQLDVQQSLNGLGLDSLTAIELQNEIETNLGIILPMVNFLQGPNIAQLAAEILARWPTQPLPSASPTAQQVVPEFPILPGQRALWFLHQLAPKSAAYNIARAIRIRGGLDVLVLQHAFQKLVERHPALRTTFVAAQGEPVCRVRKRAALFFQRNDATDWSTAFLRERLVEEAHRPFDLEQGPLLRLHLFTRSAQEHILLLTVHHIIADLWSLAVLANELDLFYQAQETSTKDHLAPTDQQYADYARWQTNMLAGPEGKRLWAYWQNQLAGELPALNLPTDRPRPSSLTFRGATFTFELHKTLATRLKALVQRGDATLYMLLLAAFQVLLYRYTSQRDILVGSPTAGRSRVGAADLVGYFVNPIILRADLSTNPTFTAFLTQVRQTVLSALAHQDYPFPLLVQQLQPQRDPSRSPLIQVMFIMQKAPLLGDQELAAFIAGGSGGSINVGGMSLEPVAIEQRATQFDLALTITEVADGLAAALQYSTDLFDRSTIVRMVDHFQRLLESIVADPEQRLSELTLLSAAEQAQLLKGWNDTRQPYALDKCIHELIAAQARQRPDSLAVACGDERLTYRELERRTDQLAHHLRGLGVGPEIPVGICVERSLDMVVGTLGILKAGGAYVPLDPAYPPQRLAFLLADVRVPVLLTQRTLVGKLPQSAVRVICLDGDWDGLAQSATTPPASGVMAENVAYVIYTSGSTGKPKGVQVTHCSLLNLIAWHIRAFDFSSADRAAQIAALAFDASVGELWPYLAAGASVHIVDQETRVEPTRLHDWLVDQGITVVFLPTPLAEQLLMLDWPAETALRYVLVGGDKLHHHPPPGIPFVLHNDYGPTENTVVSTSARVLTSKTDKAPTVGRPIDNVQVYLLDGHLNPVSVGVSGELYLGGVGLARGYLNHPGLTAEGFVPHPFSQEPGARLYKTGDLARYLLDGQLEFLGRTDHQVKLRGLRIELGEIEVMLSQHPAVRETAVLAREDLPGDKRLVAYVVPEEMAQAPASRDLRDFLRQKLPAYMIPVAFVNLEMLPLTLNGKIDRQALPAPEPERPDLEVAFVTSRTDVERTLSRIWVELLGIDQVGIYDNFFDLGGHSLLATQLISRLQAAFPEVNLSLRDFFERPTVAGLAESIETIRWVTQSAQSPTKVSQSDREEGEL